MRNSLVLLTALLLSEPALALHECGAVHAPAKAAVSEAKHGCENLRETDFFNGDPRGDAPVLARRGDYSVGVRTVEVVNPDQLDILNFSGTAPNPRYDRPLTLEVWYPAELRPQERQLTTYRDVLGHGMDNPDRPNLPFEFGGRAARQAKALDEGKPYPLVIVSHGYPGSRVLMTWLTENLASKGYVVVAIDHTESTRADAGSIVSTLVHRPRDINFVLRSVSSINRQAGSFLAGLVDIEHVAVIGYSMGSYGALSASGVGVSQPAVNFPGGVPGGHLGSLQAGHPEHEAMLDSRIKALIAIAPYAPAGFWDGDGILNLKIPSLFIVGSQDQTTGFAAAQWLFDNALNSERYLLVFQGAIHQVGANPAPPLAEEHFREYVHFQDPVWDNRRFNNVNQHFITAFLATHLQGDDSYARYLELPPISNDTPRTDTAHPDYWLGFPNWTAIGMELHRRDAQSK